MTPSFQADRNGCKTDLSLILNTLSLAVALGAGPIAAALLAAFAAGLLIAKATRPRP
jgi:hypothetical protein